MFEINLKKKKKSVFYDSCPHIKPQLCKDSNYLDSKKSVLNWFDIEEAQMQEHLLQQTQNQDQT